MNTLSERIKKVSEGLPRGWQSQLAKACGISAPSVADWLSGKTKTISGEYLLVAANFFGVNATWLATGKGYMKPTPYENTDKVIAFSRPINPVAENNELTIDESSEFEAIKRVKFKLSAGISGFSVEYLNGHRAPIFFRKDWLKSRNLSADRLFAVEVAGQSMEPSLFEGDLVVVNTADTIPADGDVFAANYEGELVIKRAIRNNGEWFLSSDNQDKRRYSDKRCDEQTSIIGRIIHKQSERI